MADPFETLLSDFHTSMEGLGISEFVDATFDPASGANVPCSIRLYKEDNLESDGVLTRVFGELTIIEYQRSEIARDAVLGETFTIGSTVYTVKGVRDRDSVSIRVVVV